MAARDAARKLRSQFCDILTSTASTSWVPRAGDVLRQSAQLSRASPPTTTTPLGRYIAAFSQVTAHSGTRGGSLLAASARQVLSRSHGCTGAALRPQLATTLRQCATAAAGAGATALRSAAGAGGPAAAAAAQVWGGAALSSGLATGARRQMAWWVGGTAAWVYTLVVLGGVTRLTKSGLSMTKWSFTGEHAPSTPEEWDVEFRQYQASPEYQKLHRGMNLAEFKFIFYMEYAHRMWGRMLGLEFALPGIYFLARGYVNGALGKRLGLLFFMGGTQGLVGWWMVRSGLQIAHEHETPRVSPYRLAAHLVSAFTIYTTLVWTAADLSRPVPLLADMARAVTPATAKAAELAGAAAKKLRGRLLPLAALVAVTATSGAFVAGMDAGRAYNTYPLMSGQLVPPEYWNPDTPGVRNFFENTAAVQFHHRMLAATTLVAVGTTWLLGAGRGGRALLPPAARNGLHAVAAITSAQFLLGIYTLLEYVPAHLGSLHQANALNLFTAVILTLHALRPATPPVGATAVLRRFAVPGALAAVASVAVAVTSTY